MWIRKVESRSGRLGVPVVDRLKVLLAGAEG